MSSFFHLPVSPRSVTMVKFHCGDKRHFAVDEGFHNVYTPADLWLILLSVRVML